MRRSDFIKGLKKDIRSKLVAFTFFTFLFLLSERVGSIFWVISYLQICILVFGKDIFVQLFIERKDNLED